MQVLTKQACLSHPSRGIFHFPVAAFALFVFGAEGRER